MRCSAYSLRGPRLNASSVYGALRKISSFKERLALVNRSCRRLSYALMGKKDPYRLETVQFHQSYGYEDFIQGYRPTEEGGFVLKDGSFYRFCQRALGDPQQDYVFVIDEINRGNLSKIFGELMLLIEHDKRGFDWATTLAYSSEAQERFFVVPALEALKLLCRHRLHKLAC